jgi:hypothetical protein
MAGMTQVVPPFTSGEDLNAKARIRIADRRADPCLTIRKSSQL